MPIYTRDAMRNIKSINDQSHPSRSKSYSYDPLYRLENAEGPWGKEVFSYDPNGNRVFQDLNGKVNMYGYGGNLMETVTTSKIRRYQYDGNGNTTSDGHLNFIYNQNNRLSKVTMDRNKKIAWRLETDPFGRVIQDDRDGFPLTIVFVTTKMTIIND